MTSEKAKPVKGLTVKSFVYAVVFAVIVLVLCMAADYSMKPDAGFQQAPMGAMSQTGVPNVGRAMGRYFFIPSAFLLFVTVLVAAVSKKMNIAEVTFIFAVVAPIPVLVATNGGIPQCTYWTFKALQSPTLRDFVTSYASSLISPLNISVLEGMYYGGTAVPWSEWMAPLAWWSIYWIAFFMFLTFWSAILRRQWVEVEALAFPLAEISGYLVEGAEPHGQSFWKNRFLWVGVAVSLVFGVLACQVALFGSSYKNWYLEVDYTPYRWYNGVPIFTFEPWIFGMCLLLPNDVLFSNFLYWVILYNVLTEVFVDIGIRGPMRIGAPAWAGVHRIFGRWEDAPAAPFGGWDYFALGVMTACVVLPMLWNWRLHLGGIKSIFSWTNAAGDENEALPLRYLWIGAAAFFVFYLATLAMVGVGILYGIILFITLVIIYTGIARAKNETGLMLGGYVQMFYHFDMEVINPLGVYIGLAGKADAAPWGAIGFYTATSWNDGTNPSDPVPWNMHFFKLGDRFNVRNRDLFIAQITGLLIGIVLSLALALWFRYSGGLVGKTLIGDRPWALGKRIFDGAYEVPCDARPGNIAIVGVGGLVYSSLYIGRALVGGVFTWLSPIALLMTTTAGIVTWLPSLGAFVVKKIAAAIAGPEKAERILKPLGVGLVMGLAILWPVATVMQVARDKYWWGLAP